MLFRSLRSLRRSYSLLTKPLYQSRGRSCRFWRILRNRDDYSSESNLATREKLVEEIAQFLVVVHEQDRCAGLTVVSRVVWPSSRGRPLWHRSFLTGRGWWRQPSRRPRPFICSIVVVLSLAHSGAGRMASMSGSSCFHRRSADVPQDRLQAAWDDGVASTLAAMGTCHRPVADHGKNSTR